MCVCVCVCARACVYVKMYSYKNTRYIICKKYLPTLNIYVQIFHTGVRGVMVTIVGNEHGGLSSNPCQSRLHFTLLKYSWEVD